MDGEILGLSPTIFWPIIAAVVLVLVVLTTVLLICCCYCCCCKYTKKKASPRDDFESTTQLTPHRSGADLASYPDDVERGGSVVWPVYTAKVDSIEHDPPAVNCKYTRKNKVSPHHDFESMTFCRSGADLASYPNDVEKGYSGMWPRYAAKVDGIGHDPPVFNINQKRAILPLPNNFSRFIIDIIVPFFNEQRLTANQFAVVVLLSEDDIDNICGTRFVPSNGGKPLLNKYHPSMPHSASHYGNYIVACPNSSWHSEEEIFGKYSSHDSPFSQLWTAYVRRNGSPPKCVLLYSWNLPCSRCTDVIIRSLNNNMYRCTSAIVAYSTYWQKELGGQYAQNKEKLKKENIVVKEVPHPEFIPPA